MKDTDGHEDDHDMLHCLTVSGIMMPQTIDMSNNRHVTVVYVTVSWPGDGMC